MPKILQLHKTRKKLNNMRATCSAFGEPDPRSSNVVASFIILGPYYGECRQGKTFADEAF